MEEEKKININLPPEVAQGTYSNMALISHSPSEFIVDFIRVVPGVQSPQVQSRIIMTPENAQKLLDALKENIGHYERSFGSIATRSGSRQSNSFSIPITGKGEA